MAMVAAVLARSGGGKVEKSTFLEVEEQRLRLARRGLHAIGVRIARDL